MKILGNISYYGGNKRVLVPEFIIFIVRSCLNYSDLIGTFDLKVNTNYKQNDFIDIIYSHNDSISEYLPVLYGYIIESKNDSKMRFRNEIDELKGICQFEESMKYNF